MSGTESVRVEHDAKLTMAREVVAGVWKARNENAALGLLRLGRCDHYREVQSALAAIEATTEVTGWRPIETAPKDGTEILIYAHEMILQARYEPGSWTDDTPISPAEYDGPVWCGFDDQINFEIEETEVCDFHGPVTHWMPLPAAPNLDPRHD